jgi:NAD(P)-dependent dehydrogenase (short-subunit alcohol dehydrogenase family)
MEQRFTLQADALKFSRRLQKLRRAYMRKITSKYCLFFSPISIPRLQLDVVRKESIRQAVAHVESVDKKLDILVNK